MADSTSPDSSATSDSAAVGKPGATDRDPRRAALIASLRQRFAAAEASGDAEAKQALFREAVYLNLPPQLWQGGEGDCAG
jgi:hypothetical protein